MMDLYFSTPLVLICLTLAIAIFSLPVFKFIDEDTDPARSNSMDGIRYVLASFVIFHHMDCAYTYITKGNWAPTSDLLLYMGKYGVALFFMITAFLFWGKIRKANEVNWVDLYKKRLYRIAPLSIFCTLAALGLLFFLTERNEFSISVVTNALSWFDVGLWNYKPPVTSFQYSFMALAGVTWTLRWEWIFYFTLPLLFIFKKWSFELTISLFAFSLYFLPGFTNDAYLWSYFFGGMLCSEIKDRIIITKKTANALLALMIIITMLAQPTLYGSPEKFFLCIIFFSVVSGANLFGFLITKAAIRLGAISYSLYLTQGLILFPVILHFQANNKFELNVRTFVTLVLCYLAICLISSATYHFIERPFIKRMSFSSLIKKVYSR
ncbi:acyltransferase [Enterobacter sp. HN503E2II]|nr:acyltransferase [Enterobacter sp. HN503E2II]